MSFSPFPSPFKCWPPPLLFPYIIHQISYKNFILNAGIPGLESLLPCRLLIFVILGRLIFHFSFFIDKMRNTNSTHLIKFCEIIYKEHFALHYAIVILHSEGRHSKFLTQLLLCDKVLFRENFIAKKYKKLRKPKEWDKHSTLKVRKRQRECHKYDDFHFWLYGRLDVQRSLPLWN